jgi:hypothetical protein
MWFQPSLLQARRHRCHCLLKHMTKNLCISVRSLRLPHKPQCCSSPPTLSPKVSWWYIDRYIDISAVQCAVKGCRYMEPHLGSLWGGLGGRLIKITVASLCRQHVHVLQNDFKTKSGWQRAIWCGRVITRMRLWQKNGVFVGNKNIGWYDSVNV